MNLIARLLVLTAGVVAFAPPLVGQDAGAAPKDEHFQVAVVRAWNPASVTVYREQLTPAKNDVFVAIELRAVGVKSLAGSHRAIHGDKEIMGISTYPDETPAHIHSIDVVLTDSTGAKYQPVGAISHQMAFFRGRSMLSNDIRIAMGGRSPVAAESLLYVYEIPAGRGGLKLTAAKAAPVPVDVE